MGVIIKKNNILSYIVCGEIPYSPKVDKLKCDRLAITLDVPKVSERNSLDKKLTKMAENDYATGDWPMKYKNGYRIYLEEYCLDIPPENASFRVHTAPQKHNYNYMRVEFNPSKAPPCFVKKHMDVLLEDGYQRLMTQGKVTMWDEAIDIHFCELKDLYLYYPNLPCSTVDYKSGMTISTYLGQKTGNKYISVYNKTKHIKETNSNFYYDYPNTIFGKEPEPTYPIMRVETRTKLSNQSYSVGSIKTLPNHFTKMKVFNHFSPKYEGLLKTETEKMIYKQFKVNCNAIGLQQARLILTSDWRKKIDPIVQKSVVTWWKPDNVKSERALVINSILVPSSIPKKHAPFFSSLKSCAANCN
jgi:hypothetical protein